MFPRPDGDVQVGCAEGRSARLRPPAPLDQHGCLMLLSLLASGRTAAQLRAAARLRGAKPSAADELVRQIRASGYLEQCAPAPARIHVHGNGPIAMGLQGALAESGARVTETQGALLRRNIPELRPELVVLGDRVVPDPSVLHQLLVAKIPHLRVRLVDGDGQIGPFVLPGRTGCLWCEQQHAADADPEWSQLLLRFGPMSGHARAGVVRRTLALAAAEVEHIVRFLRGPQPVPPPRSLGAAIEVGHDGTLPPPRRNPPHPKCVLHPPPQHLGPCSRRDDSHRDSQIPVV